MLTTVCNGAEELLYKPAKQPGDKCLLEVLCEWWMHRNSWLQIIKDQGKLELKWEN